MKGMRWLWALALVPACMGGDLDSDAIDEVAAAANSLTNNLDFAGGAVEDGDVPEADDDSLVIQPVGESILISPGDADVIMPVELDESESGEDPVVATLIQFKGSKKHIEVETGDRKSTIEAGLGRIENVFNVGDDVCDDLCNRQFEIEVTECGKRQSGKVGRHAKRMLRLDCRARGSARNCSGDVVEGDPVEQEPSGDGDGDTSVDTPGIRGEFSSQFKGTFDRFLQTECTCNPDECDTIQSANADVGVCIGGMLDEIGSSDPEGVMCILDLLDAQITCTEGSECDEMAEDACTADLPEEQSCNASFDINLIFEDCGLSTGGSDAVMEGFLCRNGDMIPYEWECDGTDDCGDGSDEANCNAQPDTFICSNGDSIPTGWVCDGADDCGDNSDELDCIGAGNGGSLLFQCFELPNQVDPAYVCNGFDECMDGSDEGLCDVEGQWICDGTSVPSEWVCDGYTDCADGTDEVYCVDGGFL